MALIKLKDFDPDYLNTFGGPDVKGRDVYETGTAEKIGTVDDILVDENSGEFRYLLVSLGLGSIGKKVLLPIGHTRMNPDNDHVYANLTKEQAERLPELEPATSVDYDYEEQVRGVYRPNTTTSSTTATMPLDSSAPLEATAPLDSPSAATAGYVSESADRDTYTYKDEPALYGMSATDHQTLKLYEERLIANKTRRKTGEVAIGKHVETETARVSVPVEKERVIIERVTPADAGKAVTPGQDTFREGEVAHVEIYEETPDIRKEAVLREEVRIRKEVEQDVANAEETIRREELDVHTDDRLGVDTSGHPNERI